MSLKTWIEEFYPITASPKMSAAEACKHGILKWRGRYLKNLKKHKVITDTYKIIEKEDAHKEFAKTFEFNCDTCALCNIYYKYVEVERKCPDCPIVKSGNISCISHSSAYFKTTREAYASPEPMLKVLRQALKYCEAHPEEFDEV